MYSLSVCVSVHGHMPALLHGAGYKLRDGRGLPLVVHCWANLQLVHGFYCYDNIAPRLMTIGTHDSIAVCLVFNYLALLLNFQTVDTSYNI